MLLSKFFRSALAYAFDGGTSVEHSSPIDSLVIKPKPCGLSRMSSTLSKAAAPPLGELFASVLLMSARAASQHDSLPRHLAACRRSSVVLRSPPNVANRPQNSLAAPSSAILSQIFRAEHSCPQARRSLPAPEADFFASKCVRRSILQRSGTAPSRASRARASELALMFLRTPIA
eukprot:scaffold4036_cov236-Pinguiococcus_pyrenoidosus.AAC.4